MKNIATFLAIALAVGFSYGQNLHKAHHDDPFHPAVKAQPVRSLEQRMIGYYTSDDYEVCTYTYNSQNQLIDVYTLWPGSDELHDSIHYNDQGQLVRIDGYQFLNGQWKHVYYIEYTYNASGRLASRANYNSATDWSQGGLYEYSYNPSGQLVLTELYMGNYVSVSVEYEYEGSLLSTETWSTGGFGMLELSEQIEYHYTDGLLTEKVDSYYDDGSWDFAGKEEFEYDANGNCTLHQTLDGSLNVTEKSVYSFAAGLVANTLMPYTPELERPALYSNRNIFLVEEYYMRDVDGVLQYACDYNYDYDENVSVNDITNSFTTIYPNPFNSLITVVNDGGQGEIEIYDAVGKLVLKEALGEGASTFNLSGCEAGLYFVKVLREGGAGETFKMVKG